MNSCFVADEHRVVHQILEGEAVVINLDTGNYEPRIERSSPT